MKKIRILFLFLAVLLLAGCLREMKEKEITISVKEEDPIKVLQGLTRETRKTEVMILGCPHFKTLQKNIKTELFDSLLSALSLFAPDQIGIQSLAPNYIRFLLNTDTELNNLLKDEINDAVNFGLIAQKKLKTNFDLAYVTADSLSKRTAFNNNSEAHSLTEELILNQVASYNLYSAALQWSYFTSEAKKKTKLIPKEITEGLENILSSPDEINLIGINLARQIGLQKLIPIDDQQDKDIYSEILPTLMNEIMDDSLYLKAANSDFYKKTDELFKQSFQKKNLLPYFLYINSQEYAIKDAESQWGVFYKLNLESGLDRTRAALWEIRNLNIASNIRRSTSLNPGSKFLVIVDPSHKPFLEAYLSSLGDIKIVQLNNFIK
jgi:hypothetical protein